MDTTVSHLLLPNGAWNVNLITQHFLSHDADSILSIPRPQFSCLDRVCWHFKKRGTYSVKSVYELGALPDVHQASSSSSRLLCWGKYIWSLNLPPKIRIFLWRLYNHILPVFASLIRHHVPVVPHCRWCGWEDECHALFNCYASMKIWKNSPFYTLVFIGVLASAWRHQVPNAASDRWSPPPHGHLKPNVDAFVEQTGLCDLGVVVCDSEGSLLAVFAKKRGCNAIAVSLAKFGLRLDEERVWLEDEFLMWVHYLALADLP
ncbi:conserved hypothetical protein [Ricinus communis]|uniref:Reverse transcriptase zinc-binding domain-containing protein n=1 Tax=Ricinus communis TaxID=3988 RepID=B9RHK6_RICCO|nr:conserved hypothetical protein [Ricinus communis]